MNIRDLIISKLSKNIMAYWKNKNKLSLNRQKESRTHLIKSVPYSHQKGQFSISSCSKNIYELLVIHWIIPKTLRHIKTCTEKVKVLVTQSCLTLCDPRDCSPTRLLCQWNSPGKNTGVRSHSLPKGSSWPWVSCS